MALFIAVVYSVLSTCRRPNIHCCAVSNIITTIDHTSNTTCIFVRREVIVQLSTLSVRGGDIEGESQSINDNGELRETLRLLQNKQHLMNKTKFITINFLS